MGLLHSKNACKRRESPEGGTLLLLQGESCPPSESHTTRHKQDVCGAELRDDHFLDHGCPLEVILPPERAAESQSYKVSSENGDPLRRNAKNDVSECPEKIIKDCRYDSPSESIHLQDMECNVPVVDENHQEWVFTLYDFDNSGRVTKEDMSSLMHTIYEVVEASVKQSALCDSKTLRVKLSVTPLISSNNRRERDIGLPPNKQDHLEENHQIHIRGQSTDPAVSSEKKLYRIDENTERRNHYLDLAGIENYTSRFDADHMSPYEEQCQDSPAHGTRSAHHRWPQLDRGSLGKSGGRRLPFLRSLRSRSKSNRLHGHHPVSWCCPPAPQQQPLHYSHSKRVHARPRDATSASVPHPGLDLELQPGTGISPGGFMPMAQRHEHHHLHEHHHHHHHHHHYYSS
ncbi:naked cuticle-like protein 3 isoform X1 [Pangasianodon hypophthalmus]|uniref:naked cuticle-like protein 3 isoform X1 n=1 Tax=Pangasianodon hypophthalmus TaxID=310915 RepID=UPI00230778AB|nr:naked cuticle-like protein 3 isoform X1 [Pangasianodon hypophthalmus]